MIEESKEERKIKVVREVTIIDVVYVMERVKTE